MTYTPHLAGSGGGGTPDPHAASHADGGTDEVTLTTAQVTGLDGALAGKEASGTAAAALAAHVGEGDPHTQYALDGHTHAIADTTGLQTALDGKAPTTHPHQPSDINGTAVITTDPRLSDSRTPTAHALVSASHTAIGLTTGHVLTALSPTTFGFAAAAGGSDPWTVAKLTVDFMTTSATAQNVTELSFLPSSASVTYYEIEGMLMVRTATATVNPRIGLAWPTGPALVDGVASIYQSQTATTELQAHGNVGAALLIAAGGIPNTTQSWPVRFSAIMAWNGAAPPEGFRVQIASETAGTTVTVKAGSFIRYRTY